MGEINLDYFSLEILFEVTCLGNLAWIIQLGVNCLENLMLGSLFV